MLEYEPTSDTVRDGGEYGEAETAAVGDGFTRSKRASRRLRDRARFDLAIDSKLRGCDLVNLKIGTLVNGPAIGTRSMVV